MPLEANTLQEKRLSEQEWISGTMLSDRIILQLRKRKPRDVKQTWWLVSKPVLELRTYDNIAVLLTSCIPSCWI